MTVGIIGSGERVEGSAKSFDGFRVSGDEKNSMNERIIERFKVGRRLRNDVVKREGTRSHHTISGELSTERIVLEKRLRMS